MNSGFYVDNILQKRLRKCGLVNKVVALKDLEKETIQWCQEIMEKSPMAIRFIKQGLNAELDGQSWIARELAGSATLLYYLTAESQEGKTGIP